MDSDHSATPPQPEPQQKIVPPPDPDPPDPEQPQNEEPTFPIDPVPDPVVDPLAPGPQPFLENEGGPIENEGVSTRPQRQCKPPQSYQPGSKGQSYQDSSHLSVLICNATAFMVKVTKFYAMTQADPDTMTLKEAMAEPHADKFLDAMIKEIQDHVQRKHWRLVSDKQMRKSGHKGKPIIGVWSMKCKSNPVGEIIKYKARFCAHGGQTQEGVHYTNTFAPVVTWTTIRFLLILSLVHGWHTRQIDFVLAYPPAKVSHDLYMLVPDKFKVQDNKLVMDQDAPPPWKQKPLRTQKCWRDMV